MINAAYAQARGPRLPAARTRTERDTVSTRILPELDRRRGRRRDRRRASTSTITPPDAHFGPARRRCRAPRPRPRLAAHRARGAARTRRRCTHDAHRGREGRPAASRSTSAAATAYVAEHDGQAWNGGADWGAVGPWQMVDMEKDAVSEQHVRIVRPHERDAGTAQTPGMTRVAGISAATCGVVRRLDGRGDDGAGLRVRRAPPRRRRERDLRAQRHATASAGATGSSTSAEGGAGDFIFVPAQRRPPGDQRLGQRALRAHPRARLRRTTSSSTSNSRADGSSPR